MCCLNILLGGRDMGRYSYTKSEKEMNKVLKYQQDELNDIGQRIVKVRSSCDARISESETLLKSLGYDLLMPVPNPEIKNHTVAPTVVSENWEDIVRQAEDRYPYDVELEDILSQAEFENAYRDLENINREFQQSTKLDGIDLSMVIVAAALQTLRWALMPAIGAPIDKASRITSEKGDELVMKLKKEFVERHKDWPTEKKQQGRRLRKQEGKTWKEIMIRVSKGSSSKNRGIFWNYFEDKPAISMTFFMFSEPRFCENGF